MRVRIKDPHPEVGQVVPRHVNATLIEIEKADRPIVEDPQVRGPRIAVNHRCRTLRERREDGEDLVDDIRRECGQISIEALAVSREFRDGRTPRALRVCRGGSVKRLQTISN